MKVFLTVVIAPLLFIMVAQAQLKITLDGAPDSLHVGEPVEIRLNIAVPPGGHLQLPRWEDAQDQFNLLAPSDTSALQRRSGANPVVVSYKTTSFEAGEQVLQPFTVRWVSDDGAKVDSAATDPIIVHVLGVVPDSILAAADTTQKPYKFLQPNRTKKLGISFAEILPWIMGIIAAGGIFYLLRWWLRRRKRKAAIVPEVIIPPRPAYEIALEELDHLRDQQLYQAGRIKEYYVFLSEIIRRYLEMQFRFPALESTSYQLLRDVETVLEDQNLRAVLQAILEDADLAKFAKHRPDEETCHRDLEKGYVFVRKTMPRPVSPIASGEAA